MKRTPQEWLQFAQDNERQDDMIQIGMCNRMHFSPDALARFAEAVRREAREEALNQAVYLLHAHGRQAEGRDIPGLAEAAILLTGFRDEVGP